MFVFQSIMMVRKKPEIPMQAPKSLEAQIKEQEFKNGESFILILKGTIDYGEIDKTTKKKKEPRQSIQFRSNKMTDEIMKEITGKQSRAILNEVMASNYTLGIGKQKITNKRNVNITEVQIYKIIEGKSEITATTIGNNKPIFGKVIAVMTIQPNIIKIEKIETMIGDEGNLIKYGGQKEVLDLKIVTSITINTP